MGEILSELRLVWKCSVQHYQVPEGRCCDTRLICVKGWSCFRFDLFLAQRCHCHMVSKLFAVRNRFLEDCSGKLRLLIADELSLGRAGNGYVRR